MDTNDLVAKVSEAIPAIQAQTLGKLKTVADLIERGDYVAAINELNVAAARLQRLSWLQENVATFAGTFVVKAKDITAGTNLHEWGVVTERRDDHIVCPQHGPHDVIHLTFESGQEAYLHDDDEIMVVSGGS